MYFHFGWMCHSERSRNIFSWTRSCSIVFRSCIIIFSFGFGQLFPLRVACRIGDRMAGNWWMLKEQSSMTLDNVAGRCRRNWAILFLSIILFMFDSFLLIPFCKAQLEIFWSSKENLAHRFSIIFYTFHVFFFCWSAHVFWVYFYIDTPETAYWVGRSFWSTWSWRRKKWKWWMCSLPNQNKGCSESAAPRGISSWVFQGSVQCAQASW